MGPCQRGPNVDQLRKYSISPHIYGTLRSSGEAENWELWKYGTLGAAIFCTALLPHRVPIVTEPSELIIHTVWQQVGGREKMQVCALSIHCE